jgi:hypothetical protein
MQVDWEQKWLLISQAQEQHLLQGELSALPEGSVLQVSAIVNSDTAPEQASHPPEIAALLSEFELFFAPPTGYPPARHCDHAIHLIPGASPVNIRPCRYPPAIKDEIERQVTEMLKSAVIKPSSSPFSSSVLLVKKKDGSFRFCIDFRHLNAITSKIKYPVPVIEELLDELMHPGFPVWTLLPVIIK